MQFEGKVVLVTGSSRGIGKATALAFGKEGAKVVVNYLNSEKEALSVVDQIKENGADAIAIKCDVSNEEGVRAMISETVDKFGKLDVLVNNTGIVFDIPMLEKTVEQWRQSLDVNLIGTFLCSKYAAPYLKETKGKIVNISSTNAFNSFSPESADYDSTKAGVVLLTKNLAKQLAPDVLVNSVAPGCVDTDMNKELPKDFVDEETQKTYLKRWAEPKEIAEAVLFFASDKASYITGSVLIVDGGHD